MKRILFLTCLSLVSSAFAQNQSIVPSAAELSKAMESNRAQSQRIKSNSLFSPFASGRFTSVARPWAEYEKAKYLFFADSNIMGSDLIKQQILSNLPAGVTAVIYTTASSTQLVRNLWSPYLAPGAKLEVLYAPDIGNNFWGRDALPIPVIGLDGRLKVVDAQYYHHYNADRYFAEFASAELIKHSFFYEGGNFANDRKGNCFLVQAGTAKNLPDQILKESYGCHSITRLPYVAGIGHVDERVKIISDRIALTDVESYIPYLQKKGFEVRLLPQSRVVDGTYVNSLQVNGTVFLPVFRYAEDEDAIRVYEDLGFKVIPIDANKLVKGRGSIHCITMTYPEALSVSIPQKCMKYQDQLNDTDFKLSEIESQIAAKKLKEEQITTDLDSHSSLLKQEDDVIQYLRQQQITLERDFKEALAHIQKIKNSSIKKEKLQKQIVELKRIYDSTPLWKVSAKLEARKNVKEAEKELKVVSDLIDSDVLITNNANLLIRSFDQLNKSLQQKINERTAERNEYLNQINKIQIQLNTVHESLNSLDEKKEVLQRAREDVSDDLGACLRQ